MQKAADQAAVPQTPVQVLKLLLKLNAIHEGINPELRVVSSTLAMDIATHSLSGKHNREVKSRAQSEQSIRNCKLTGLLLEEF
eukprot:IDg2893t1